MDNKLNQVLLHPGCRVGADLEQWFEQGGAKALAVAFNDPASLIPVIAQAGLRGLGGSGFPAHIKWQAVAEKETRPQTDKYLICNGNEDEPGTFKDAILLRETPHQLITGALIAALACGINKIIFYINPDLRPALDCMRRAIQQWRQNSWFLTANAQLERPMELHLSVSSGHYIGGEETAAIESVEGRFPFPRGRPPFPAEYGVSGCPTLVNNIETLCNVPHIIARGAAWYIRQGIDNAHGTKLYSLSGDVLNPGIYELPMGTSLRELIFTYGGGMLQGKKFKAVFTGGPSNTLLTPVSLDVPLDFDSVSKLRASLGTGAMIVVSEGTGIVKKVAEYVNFFAHSSCGQCPSCKTGTYYISMLLDKIDTGQGRQSDLEQLMNLCEILPGSGKCALIDGAVKVLDSSLYHFMGEYARAIKN